MAPFDQAHQAQESTTVNRFKMILLQMSLLNIDLHAEGSVLAYRTTIAHLRTPSAATARRLGVHGYHQERRQLATLPVSREPLWPKMLISSTDSSEL